MRGDQRGVAVLGRVQPAAAGRLDRDHGATRLQQVYSALQYHRYPQHFFKFLTLPLTVVCYKVNYLPAGVRIWFWPNCGIRVFGDMANFSSEIG